LGFYRIRYLDVVMGRIATGIILLIHFLLGIATVVVMIVILHQSSEINTLRNKVLNQKIELEKCSGLKNDCIRQLGCFYRDPLKELQQNNRQGQTYVSNKH